MKVTRRQKDVISKMIQLYHQLNGRPIHYTELAQFVGVNRFTAYDMLKVLEDKGLVQSRYRNNEQGTGRSEVVFEPTNFAHTLVAAVSPEIESDQWQTSQPINPQNATQEAIGREVLARILPTAESPNIQDCAELHAALLIRLQHTPHYAQLKKQLPRLLPLNTTIRRSHLTLLNGMSLGLLTNTQPNDNTWWNELLDQAERHQQLILRMTPPECHRLAEIIHHLFTDTHLPTHTN